MILLTIARIPKWKKSKKKKKMTIPLLQLKKPQPEVDAAVEQTVHVGQEVVEVLEFIDHFKSNWTIT